MIITGLYVPNNTMKKLASSIADIHREVGQLTVTDLRKRMRGWNGGDGSHLCYFHFFFGPRDTIKSISARLLLKPESEFRRSGFEARAPLFATPGYAAKQVAHVCGEFLVRREVERRQAAGVRELIQWTDEALADSIAAWPRYFSTPHDCGSLGEALQLRLVRHEQGCRQAESNHERMRALAENGGFLETAQKRLGEEKEQAMRWAEAQKAAGRRINVPYGFENRSEDDRVVIAFRTAHGW